MDARTMERVVMQLDVTAAERDHECMNQQTLPFVSFEEDRGRKDTRSC